MRAPRIEPSPEFTTQAGIGLDDEVNVFPVLLDDVVHRRGSTSSASSASCCFERSTPNLLCARARAALLVDVPGVGLVAAADDAELADDVVLLGVRRDDREPIDMALECHGSALQHVRQAAVKQLVDAFGVDVALGVDPQQILGKVLRSRDPRFPGRRFRNRNASSGRGSSASCPRSCS